MSAAEGRLSAPIATSWACEAFSRASKARPMAPVSSGLSSSSESALPRRSSVFAAESLAKALRDIARVRHPRLSRLDGGVPTAAPVGFRPRPWMEGYGDACRASCSCSSSSSSPGCSAHPTGATCCATAPTPSPSAWWCSRRSRAGAAAPDHAGRRGWVTGGAGGASAMSAPEPRPTPVATTRVTVIDPVPLSADAQARAWLEELDRERGRRIGRGGGQPGRALPPHRRGRSLRAGGVSRRRPW